MRSTVEIAGLSVIVLIIILGGIVGNLLVLLALRSRSMGLKPSSLLLGNLAMSDLLLATLVQPYQLATIIDPSIIEDSGLLCHIGGTASYPIFIVSVWTLVGMCIDRFYALGNPLLYRVRITFNVALGMIIYPWVHGIVVALGIGFGVGAQYDPESKDCGLGWKKSHIALSLFVMLSVVVPFFVLAVSNILIVMRLRSHNEEMRQLRRNQTTHSSGVPSNLSHNQGVEKKVTIMVSWILAIFIFCWLPYLTTRALALANIEQPSFVQTGAVWILHANSMINPILYTRFRSDLKSAIMQMLRRDKNQANLDNQLQPRMRAK